MGRKGYAGIFGIGMFIIVTLLGCAMLPEKKNTDDKSVKKFSKNEKLGVLFDSPEMGSFARFLISRSNDYAERLKNKSLVDLNKDAPTWNAQSMEDGINHMLDIIHGGTKVDYDFWSAEAREVSKDKNDTKLFYFPGKSGEKFVLLCAGGGYSAVCSMVEAFPVAERLNKRGYNVFVLSYRVNVENVVDKAIEDVSESLKFIIENKDTFNVSIKNYAMCGFSAGGNLTAEWAREERGWGKYGIDRPSCIFLGYGFISNVNEITPNYPPSYIFYCEDDNVVSPDGQVKMVASLSDNGVNNKVKAGKTGGHGFGLGTGTDAEGWVEEAIDFWEAQIAKQ